MMKIAATIAKTRPATVKQNARRTSRVILLPESRVEWNNHTHMLVIHTLYTLFGWVEGNMVASFPGLCVWAEAKNMVVVACYVG